MTLGKLEDTATGKTYLVYNGFPLVRIFQHELGYAFALFVCNSGEESQNQPSRTWQRTGGGAGSRSEGIHSFVCLRMRIQNLLSY